MKYNLTSRVISIDEVSAKKRYGWLVTYYGRVMGEKQVAHTRTTNLKTGALLKKPVVEMRTEIVPMSGVITKILRRRSSLRKLGVHI
jgi:hypothetical protein